MSSIISVNHCKNESGHANFSVPENCRLDAADFESFSFNCPRFHWQKSIRTSALPAIGDVVWGKYRLQEVIGDGGIGIVFKARDITRRKGECVAIKFYCPKKGRTADMQGIGNIDERVQSNLFINGVRNSRLLSCGYTPAVLQTGLHGEIPFVITELIRGEDLRTLLERNPFGLPYQSVLKISIQICYALQELHNIGLVHRDIKPANIMLRNDGRLALLDFDCLWSPNLEKGQIRERVAGTLAYLRPEELSGKNCSSPGDVYSLGCTIYELLTGKKLHPQSEQKKIIDSHLSGAKPVVIPHVPRSLSNIILKAVSRDPEKRFRSAAEMRLELEKVLKGEDRSLLKRSLSLVYCCLTKLARTALSFPVAR